MRAELKKKRKSESSECFYAVKLLGIKFEDRKHSRHVLKPCR